MYVIVSGMQAAAAACCAVKIQRPAHAIEQKVINDLGQGRHKVRQGAFFGVKQQLMV